jgi:hypothetical protein
MGSLVIRGSAVVSSGTTVPQDERTVIKAKSKAVIEMIFFISRLLFI